MHKVTVNPSLHAALSSDLTELAGNWKKPFIPCFSDFLRARLPQSLMDFF